jgi:hypothetical protein
LQQRRAEARPRHDHHRHDARARYAQFVGRARLSLPQYLTTPDIRQKYPVELLRYVLFGALLVAGVLSVVNLVRRRRRSLNALALGLVAVAVAWGGSAVPVGDFPKHTPYIGLDWFIIDLLLSG